MVVLYFVLNVLLFIVHAILWLLIIVHANGLPNLCAICLCSCVLHVHYVLIMPGHVSFVHLMCVLI